MLAGVEESRLDRAFGNAEQLRDVSDGTAIGVGEGQQEPLVAGQVVQGVPKLIDGVGRLFGLGSSGLGIRVDDLGMGLEPVVERSLTSATAEPVDGLVIDDPVGPTWESGRIVQSRQASDDRQPGLLGGLGGPFEVGRASVGMGDQATMPAAGQGLEGIDLATLSGQHEPVVKNLVG